MQVLPPCFFCRRTAGERANVAAFDETTTSASGVALCRRNPDRALHPGSAAVPFGRVARPGGADTGLGAGAAGWAVHADCSHRLDQSHAPDRHPVSYTHLTL